MRLSELKMGERGIIVKIYGNGGFRKRIIEMGFIRGKTVEVLLNAPLHDPIVYKIIGYKISLRREEARMIEVISESEAAEHEKELFPEMQKPIECEDPQNCTPHTLDDNRRQQIMEKLAGERQKVIRVALLGNPNCGKTSMFNVASGGHEHVGNYSGVTVDAKEGNFNFEGYHFIIVDLPGTYSLSAYSPEELYVRKNLVENTPDVIINVIDGSNLERNLYLTMQLLDMNFPMVIALNMYDELEKSGDKFEYKSLASMLGTPIVPTVSRNGKGIKELFHTVINVYNGTDSIAQRHIHVNHGDLLEKSINKVRATISKTQSDLNSKYSLRYLAIKLLENDSDIEKVVSSLPNHEEITAITYEEKKHIEEEFHESSEAAIVDAKYGFISGALKETYHAKVQKAKQKPTITDKIDSVVTSKYLGYPIFILLLYLIFEATFSIGQYPMDWIDWLIGKLSDFVRAEMPAGMLKDLISDGVIGGVGAVIVFLPNILILYFFISLLEDSGYMARAAFIMDKLMHKMGLHGKSFIPMIMGFGCNVPAIMASRIIESPKSRLVTMLVTPFMSCSARIPLYIVLIGAFFPKHASLMMLGLYTLGIVIAIIMARVLSRALMKKGNLPFVMELPPYRIPTSNAILRHTWEKGKQYLKKMGGIILFASILIWALGYFPYSSTSKSGSANQENSYLARLGRAITPVTKPLGFDWRMNAGVIAGTGAKELVVSTMGVLYSQTETSSNENEITSSDNESQNDEEMHLQAAVRKTMTPQSALSYLVFVLLYFPCLATIAAIKNETGKWKWAVFAACYTTVIAYICALIVYRIAILLM